MKKILFGLIVCLSIFPNVIKASQCSVSDKERLQKFADNVTVTLKEETIDGRVYIKALFAGVSKEIRIYDERTAIYYRNHELNYISDVDYAYLKQGNTYKLRIYGNDSCQYNNFRTITLNIPIYNIYYGNPICENAQSYVLCQKWYDNSNLSYEEFELKVKDYIYTTNKNEVNNDDNSLDYYDVFMNLYKKYYVWCLSILLVVLIILIILWIKQNKKNKL